MRKLKFLIVTSRDFSGGAIVRHRLCALLRKNGYNARILYSNAFGYRPERRTAFAIEWILRTFVDFGFEIISYPYRIFTFLIPRMGRVNRLEKYFNYPIKGWKRKILPFVDEDTVVIYPEVTYGNPLNAKKVVRWFLYFSPFVNESGGYGKDDLFFCYREKFNDERYNPEKRTLLTPYFDLDLYKQTNFGERTGKCYIIRKGKSKERRTDIPENLDGPVIDNLSEKEKVKVFNKCKYCLSYDTQTSYSSIASICGCISIVMPEPGKTFADYKTATQLPNGVAWGTDQREIERAVRTRNLLVKQYEDYNKQGEDSALHFIEICNEYFKEIKQNEQ